MKTATASVGAGPSPASLDELQRTVSASRLNTWLSCRLRFYFKYVLGLTKPRTAALYVGHTVHGVLRVWNLARWRKEMLSPEQLKEQFDQLWLKDQVKEGIRWQDPRGKVIALRDLARYLPSRNPSSNSK